METTYEQDCALIIMAANRLGVEVGFLSDAEAVIKEGKHIHPCNALLFEQAAAEAHDEIVGMGEEMQAKADSMVEQIKREYVQATGVR